MNFLPVPNYEDSYEISDTGEIRSVSRIVIGADGITYPFKGMKKKPYANIQTGYFMVHLYKNNVSECAYIHRLVALVFIPNPHNKPEVNHKDGNRQNNSIDNLEWVTSAENSQHAVNTGLLTYTNRLTREEFITCLQDVIAGESYYSLSQRVPYKVPFLSVKLRKLAKEIGVEHLLDESLMLQKQRRARINGAANQ